MLAIIIAPITIQIIVEQVKGPGYGATAAEIMLYLLLTMTVLGFLTVLNLIKAMGSVAGKQDS